MLSVSFSSPSCPMINEKENAVLFGTSEEASIPIPKPLNAFYQNDVI